MIVLLNRADNERFYSFDAARAQSQLRDIGLSHPLVYEKNNEIYVEVATGTPIKLVEDIVNENLGQ